MLSEKLKRRTQQSHVAVEKLLLPKIKNIESNERYIELLNIFLGFFKPLEEQIGKFIDPAHLPDVDERRKAAALELDKETMSADSATDYCADLPPIDSVPQAIGAMYVLEGSTLGGVHISKMINSRLENASLHFFNGYGDDTMNKWSGFQSFINHYTETKDEETIIQSADETFIKMKKWIENN